MEQMKLVLQWIKHTHQLFARNEETHTTGLGNDRASRRLQLAFLNAWNSGDFGVTLIAFE